MKKDETSKKETGKKKGAKGKATTSSRKSPKALKGTKNAKNG